MSPSRPAKKQVRLSGEEARRERVKELNCFYAFSELASHSNIMLDDLLFKAADLLPPAFWHPEETSARILLGEQSYTSSPFQESETFLTAPILLNGAECGYLRVYRAGYDPASEQEAFLPEEQKLIDTISAYLGHFLDGFQAEAAARESEQKLNLAQKVAHVGSWEFNRKTGMVRASEEARNLYGVARQEWSIQEVRGVPLPEYRAMLDEALNALIENRQPYDLEFRIKRPLDGKIRWIHSMAEYSLQHDLVIGTIQDITERKLAEQQLAESEARLKEAQHTAHVGSWDWNIRTGEVWWSEEAYRIFGVSPETFTPTYDSHLSLIPPEEVDAYIQTVQNALTGKKPFKYEIRIQHPCGDRLHCVVRGKVRLDNDGQPLGMGGTVLDVTELKRVQEALERFFKQAQVLLCIAGFDGYFKRINPQFTRTLGYSEQELLSRPFNDFVHADDCLKTNTILQYLSNGENVHNFCNRYVTKDGRIRTLEWTSASDMERKLVYAIAQDVTERDRLAEQLRQAQKMQAIGKLAGGVAHDFNNQLAAITGFAEMLQQKIKEEPLAEYIKNILISANHSAGLTRQLLAFSRHGQYQQAPVNVDTLIGEVISILRRSLDKNIKITKHLEAKTPTVMGDESQLQNALLNLAINARDAMPHGGTLDFSSKNVFIEKNASNEFDENFAEGHYLQISVSDTGVGISSEHLSQIFEPFFTTKEPGQGTGMGLAAVYGTVQGHNGQIRVCSEKGHGTTFNVYLPVTTESVQPQKADEPPPRQENARYRIWVIDDEKTVREMLIQILKSEGHTVDGFETATAALDLFKKEKDRVDLIILDMIMPCMSGHQAFHAFREIDPKAKILISSGFSSDHLAQDLLKSGAVGFLQKPYQMAELAARINEAINS